VNVQKVKEGVPKVEEVTKAKDLRPKTPPKEPKEGEFGHSVSDRIWLSFWPMPDD
jgi:hypothetical protein